MTASEPVVDSDDAQRNGPTVAPAGPNVCDPRTTKYGDTIHG